MLSNQAVSLLDKKSRHKCKYLENESAFKVK